MALQGAIGDPAVLPQHGNRLAENFVERHGGSSACKVLHGVHPLPPIIPEHRRGLHAGQGPARRNKTCTPSASHATLCCTMLVPWVYVSASVGQWATGTCARGSLAEGGRHCTSPASNRFTSTGGKAKAPGCASGPTPASTA